MIKQLSHQQIGIIYAFSAYFMWGFVPLYFKFLGFVPVYEILAHRIIWSVFFTALFICYLKDWPDVFKVCLDKKILLMLTLSAFFVTANWLVFIWSINNDQMLAASLGYFINPLVNVLLGFIFLNERLSRLRWIAVSIACLGVIVQAWQLGSLPWISLVLASSFGLYGLIRKKIKVKAITGLFIETLMVMPVALIFLLFFAESDTANMFTNSSLVNLLLINAGLVTALPLIFFGQAALRLPLSTLGFFQYMAPSMMFVFAIVLYHEPISMVKLFTFICIWIAIFLFVFENQLGKIFK